MVIECVAAAAVSVVITALYGAEARRLFRAFVRSSLHLIIFFCFWFYFFFNFRVELASRARWRQRRSVGFTPVDDPLIYWAHLSTTTSFTAT